MLWSLINARYWIIALRYPRSRKVCTLPHRPCQIRPILFLLSRLRARCIADCSWAASVENLIARMCWPLSSALNLTAVSVTGWQATCDGQPAVAFMVWGEMPVSAVQRVENGRNFLPTCDSISNFWPALNDSKDILPFWWVSNRKTWVYFYEKWPIFFYQKKIAEK